MYEVKDKDELEIPNVRAFLFTREDLFLLQKCSKDKVKSCWIEV